MPPASFALQGQALIVKSALQQKRAIKTNMCLLSAPLVFCMVVWLLQNVVMSLILASPNNQVQFSALHILWAGLAAGYPPHGLMEYCINGPILVPSISSAGASALNAVK